MNQEEYEKKIIELEEFNKQLLFYLNPLQFNPLIAENLRIINERLKNIEEKLSPIKAEPQKVPEIKIKEEDSEELPELP